MKSLLLFALILTSMSCGPSTGCPDPLPPNSTEQQLIINGGFEDTSTDGSIPNWEPVTCGINPTGISQTTEVAHSGMTSLKMPNKGCGIISSHASFKPGTKFKFTMHNWVTFTSGGQYICKDQCMRVQIYWYSLSGNRIDSDIFYAPFSQYWQVQEYEGKVPTGAVGMRLEITQNSSNTYPVMFVDDVELIIQ